MCRKSSELNRFIICWSVCRGTNTCIEVILQLGRTENYYRRAFQYIYHSFGEIVYISSAQFERQRLQFLASTTKSEVLIRLFNGVTEVTYKQLSAELMKELDKQMVETQSYHLRTQTRFAEMQGKLQQKSELIRKLSSSIDYYENHPSKQQYNYIGQLQTKLATTENDLRRARSHIGELTNSTEYLNQYNNMLSEKIEELRVKLYEYEIAQFSGLKEVEKNSELKQFQSNLEVLKDLIHKGALRMASMREEYNKIDVYNQELLGERSVLAKRAAVGFAELTPRPNYKKIFQDNELDADTLIPPHLKPTTEELVASLIKCFKQFYQRYVQTQRLDLERKSERNSRGADPGSFILGELEKASKQLKKTENLADQVRFGYAKQKEEKEQASKRKKK